MKELVMDAAAIAIENKEIKVLIKFEAGHINYVSLAHASFEIKNGDIEVDDWVLEEDPFVDGPSYRMEKIIREKIEEAIHDELTLAGAI